MKKRGKHRQLQEKRGSAIISDDGIKFLIDEKLRSRRGLRTNRLRITVRNGVVKLWGSVPSFEESLNVEQTVGTAAAGVTRIENYLKIEP